MAAETFDLVVVGAGPAGMAAARSAHDAGLAVLLVESRNTFGGQVYRGASLGPFAGTTVLGAEYQAAGAAIAELERSDIARWTGATVVGITEALEMAIVHENALRALRPRAVIIATGATERPVAVPGWTLPGVMTAGAAQIALKSGGLVAEDAVFAGSGPLLYLVVAQYLQAGARIRAVFDTTARANYAHAIVQLPAAMLSSFGEIWKGIGWIRAARKAHVPVHTGVRELRISGENSVECIEATSSDGTRWRYETSHVFLHEGVVPGIDLALAAGCRSHWNARQQSWQIVTDPASGQTSVPGLFLSGDAAVVRGADAAATSGTLVGLSALRHLRRDISTTLLARERDKRRALERMQPLRRFLDTLYDACGATTEAIDGDTIACRCESVSHAQVQAAASVSPRSLDAIKSLCRAGMGPCQGRSCALTLRSAALRAWGQPTEEVPPPRVRFPIRPVSLGALADALDGDLRR